MNILYSVQIQMQLYCKYYRLSLSKAALTGRSTELHRRVIIFLVHKVPGTLFIIAFLYGNWTEIGVVAQAVLGCYQAALPWRYSVVRCRRDAWLERSACLCMILWAKSLYLVHRNSHKKGPCTHVPKLGFQNGPRKK